jgi:hypothetical protein
MLPVTRAMTGLRLAVAGVAIVLPAYKSSNTITSDLTNYAE